MNFDLLRGLLAATILGATSLAAAAHPIVPAFERLLADAKHVPAVDGRFLAGELNCAACHQGQRAPEPKPAPNLDLVGQRVQPQWLERYLRDPQRVKPGATMPDVLSTEPSERAEQAEALTHYLLSLTEQRPAYTFASPGAKLLGERTFFRVGCAACHMHRADADQPLATSVPLGDLPAKYTLNSLSAFLRNPQHVRKGGRMPSLNLTPDESQAIAAWLLNTPEVAQIVYSYYEGNFDKLPDFEQLTPTATGEAESIDVSMRKRNDQFALRFESGLIVDQAGEYTFHIGSDDGSALWIDGQQVVAAPGVHPYQVKSGKVRLEPGGHRVVVEYFEAGGEEKLTVEFEGPGIKRQPLANSLSSTQKLPDAPDLSFEVDLDKAARGKQWFASLGCANCHATSATGSKLQVAQRVSAPAWDRLRLEAGCLAGGENGAPNYALSNEQARAIKAAARQQPPTASVDKIHQTLATFNCYACHRRGELGGVEEARASTFQTTMQEMGDEGRIPPKLDEAGAKLTDYWIDKTLGEGAKDRPYMYTRMPKFGLDNVGHLRPLLVEADQQPALPPVQFSAPMKEVKELGRKMVGIRGFSCTQCHPFGRFPSKGIQSVDFVIMTKRLREDWFRKYVRNPQAYRPRTRMPTAWPVGGPSLLKSILDGDSELQIAAVWAYLSDGEKARIPEGMVTKSMELVPVEEAIIYRNFIEGAGPRAIGVGYPEHVHQAFDANNLRIALLWEGRYIDASRHWNGRGQGFQPPAGDNVLKLHDGVPFATLDRADAPQQLWPTEDAKSLGYQFQGYRLDPEQRPTFLYRLGETRFEEYLEVRPDRVDAQARRKITVRNAAAHLYFRAAAGQQIQPLADGWYSIDGRWETRLPKAKAVIRNGKELLVPVPVGESTLVQAFRW